MGAWVGGTPAHLARALWHAGLADASVLLAYPWDEGDKKQKSRSVHSDGSESVSVMKSEGLAVQANGIETSCRRVAERLPERRFSKNAQSLSAKKTPTLLRRI